MTSILVIEGDAAVAALFARIMAQSEWKVETCSEIGPAIDALNGEKTYDVILVSYKIPGGDGLEIVRLIRALGHRRLTPVLVVSGTDGIEEAAFIAGADEVLKKPIDMHTLLAAVTKHVECLVAGGC